jgi:uracil phosphoribosyltransferase
MLSLFPEACVFHLGLYRDKVSFTPTEYYSKLPLTFEKHCDIVYLLDPVVATGGTACAAVNMLLDAGLEMRRIKLLAVIASMPGLQTILKECPGLEIYVAAVDQELTKEGYINPGLGGQSSLVPLCAFQTDPELTICLS